MPTQRFYHIRPKKRAAIKDAIIRQLSEVPLEKFSAKKLSEELDLSSGSFSGYFENRADMINYILQDYIDYEEKLFGELLEKIKSNAFSEITEIVEKLVEFAESAGLLPVLKNLFADIKVSINSSFEYIAQETGEIADQIQPILMEKIIKDAETNEEKLREVINNAVQLAVLSYRYTLTEIYNHYERKEQYLQMFRLEIQIILEGLVGKIKKEINQ